MFAEEELQKLAENKERAEHLEHQNVLLALNSILKTKEGQQIFRYLFKNLEVGTIPGQGLEENFLRDYLGFLRAGNSIYKLVCEADPAIAASILSKIEREDYEYKRAEYRIRNGYEDPDERGDED